LGRKLRWIFLREFAGRVGRWPAGSSSSPDNSIVYELVAIRMRPFAVHVEPAVGRLDNTSERWRSLLWRLGPEVCPGNEQGKDEEKIRCSLK
jgi:hypothetical protein